jgi:hypothetical protein
MIPLINMKKTLFIVLFFIAYTFVYSQDLKITEIKVVESIKVSVPDAIKLNTKASFLDTSKQDKTQSYSFIDEVYYSNFITRPLVAAKLKSNDRIDINTTSLRLSLGNYSFKSAEISYNSKYKKTFSYGVRVLTNNNKYITEQGSYNAKNNNQQLYLFTKSTLIKHTISSSFKYENFVAQHDYSNIFNNDSENSFTYSKLFCSINSRNLEANRLAHKTSFMFSDLNSLTENYIGISSEMSNLSVYKPLNLLIQFNNYLNYSNTETSFGRDITDVKIIDFNPSILIYRGGFDIDFGFNLGIENNESINTVDIFPLITINKELVDGILNISFGIDRSDYRNTIASLSRENPYIHSFGLNSGSVNDSIGYSHLLETTDIYEAFFVLENQLSRNEFLDFKFSYGKILNLHYFDIKVIDGYNRFSVNYIDVWQLKLSGHYYKKFNNLLSLKLAVDYFDWFDVIVPHKSNFISTLELPFTLRNKIKITPSLSFLGTRKALQQSGDLIYPPQFNLVELEEQYIVDLNINYNYSKKLSFHIDINNISNSKKELWNGYQQIGLNMVFGFNRLF